MYSTRDPKKNFYLNLEKIGRLFSWALLYHSNNAMHMPIDDL